MGSTAVTLDSPVHFSSIPEGADSALVATAAHHWLYQTLVGMCQRPSGISIDTRIDDTGVQFTINVDPADYGYIVGKQGRNMRAIRTLAGCMAKRYRTRFEVVLDFPRPTN